MNNNLNVVSFFSGAGGFDIGFKQAGYNIVFASDYWNQAAETYKLNHPKTSFIEANIQSITKKQIHDILESKKIDNIHVMIGGPPCQCYTRLNNNNLSKDDKRNELFREYMRMIRIIKPEWVVMENVPDMLLRENNKGKEIKHLIMKSFWRNGYKADFKIFELEKYGVPQKRRRVIFIATSNKNADITFPKESSKIPTVNDNLNKLKGMKKLKNHYLTTNEPEVKLRIKHIPPGGYYRDLPDHLKTKKIRDGKLQIVKRYGSYYRRLKGDEPSLTITKNFLIHPTKHRYLSNREKAVIHSFPVDYEFCGTNEGVSTQIANAVPPEFARRIAVHLMKNAFKNI